MKFYTDPTTGFTHGILSATDRGQLARAKSILSQLFSGGSGKDADHDELVMAADIIGHVLATNGKPPDDTSPEYDGKTDDPLSN